MSPVDQVTAVVFPGMGGSTFADVGRFMVLDKYVRPRLAIADDVLGESVLAGLRAEHDDYGAFAQVAFLVNSLALADRAEAELGLAPDFCVGPSQGQRAASVYAGSIGFADAIRLTVELAHCEKEYFAAESDDLVTHCYVRVPVEPLEALLTRLTERGEWIEVSGYLDHGSYLISLRSGLLDELTRAVRDLGGYSMQTMRPAVHARRFAPLRTKAQAVLSRYRLTDPAMPVVADQDGRLVRTATELRRMLLDGFDTPLDWLATVAALAGHRVRTMYVTGPDRLFHRLDCTVTNFQVVPVTPESAAKPSTRS